jgi:hypothetical protein
MGNMEFFGNLVAYLPNAIFAYGFIADIVNQRYHYSIASITSLIGMVINKYIGGPLVSSVGTSISNWRSSRAAPGRAAPPPPPGGPAGVPPEVNPFAGMGGKRRVQRGGALPCDVPGFEWLSSDIAPQSIVMSMTVLWYILIESWDTGQGSQTIALGVTTAIVFFLQCGVLRAGDCRFGVWSFVIALIMGITFAGTSYGIQKLLPQSTNSSAGPNATYGPGNTIGCPNGQVFNKIKKKCMYTNEQVIQVGDQGGQSEPVNDDDQFVCEAYRDGELITSTIVE